jgi:hypothetical protein
VATAPQRKQAKGAEPPPPRRAYDVFVSGPATPLRDDVLSILDELGLRAFNAERDLQGGRLWRTEIAAAIEEAEAVVVIGARGFEGTQSVLDDLGAAHNAKKSIIFVADGSEWFPSELGPGAFVDVNGLSREQLAASLRHELAAVGALPAAPRLVVGTRVLADTPTEDDALGFGPVVRGLAALLDDPGTALPLSIGITARWGGGKSSVMLQLRRQLDPHHDEKKSWSSGDRCAPGVTRRGCWRTVFFPAWLYEGREPLWAALAQAIYEQPQARMGPLQRLRFRLLVEQERSGLTRLVAMFIAVPLLVAAFAVAAAADGREVIAAVTGGGAVLAALKAGWTAFGRSFRSALQRYARLPDYGDHVGFANKARTDVEALLRAVTRDGRSLGVFVDDLDRLSSEHAVEIVETVNQMFHASDERVAFVLGFDPGVVAASIDAAYEDVVLHMKDEALRRDFGREFLSKIVQLVVAVPPPMESALAALLADRHPDAPSHVDELPQTATDGGSEPARPPRTILQEETRTDQGIRRSPEVLAAEEELLAHCPANPRQVKRLVNAFRLQLYIAVRDPRRPIELQEPDLRAMARWIVLRQRFPDADRKRIATMENDSPDDPLLHGGTGEKRISELDLESFVTIV